MKDILDRFWEMKREAPKRGIEVSDKQLCTLVLADVVKERGLAIERQLEEIDKSLVVIGKHTR